MECPSNVVRSFHHIIKNICHVERIFYPCGNNILHVWQEYFKKKNSLVHELVLAGSPLMLTGSSLIHSFSSNNAMGGPVILVRGSPKALPTILGLISIQLGQKKIHTHTPNTHQQFRSNSPSLLQDNISWLRTHIVNSL